MCMGAESTSSATRCDAHVPGHPVIGPLDAADPFYLDLAEARGSKSLARLQYHLREAAERGSEPCHLAFIGHRGSGKSTELIRLESQLKDVYYPIHLYLDQSITATKPGTTFIPRCGHCASSRKR